MEADLIVCVTSPLIEDVIQDLCVERLDETLGDEFGWGVRREDDAHLLGVLFHPPDVTLLPCLTRSVSGITIPLREVFVLHGYVLRG